MKNVSRYPFAMVPLAGERSGKPRTTGITMMMDWGLPCGRVKDNLELLAPYVDLVKIVVGTARLYAEDYLIRKLSLYKESGVEPFLGGQFAEYVFATQGMQAMGAFFAEAKRVGFEEVEISDNCVSLTEPERRALIHMAIDRGLGVHGEVGSKVEKQAPEILVAQAKVCFDAGCRVVLVEAAELVDHGTPNRELVVALRNELDLSKVLFELSGSWIKGTTLSDVYELKKFLISEFGPDVNLANVMPDDVFETEALRNGLSVVGPDDTGS
ncbi:MAG: phosphosulfolactate synthase [Thermoanaerobaculales bacterium]